MDNGPAPPCPAGKGVAPSPVIGATNSPLVKPAENTIACPSGVQSKPNIRSPLAVSLFGGPAPFAPAASGRTYTSSVVPASERTNAKYLPSGENLGARSPAGPDAVAIHLSRLLTDIIVIS